MSAPTHFNQRLNGVPGGTNVLLMTKDQEALMRHLRGRARSDPRGIAMMLMRHMTEAEQAEALRVYDMVTS